MEEEFDKVLKYIDLEESYYTHSSKEARMKIFIDQSHKIDEIRNESTGDIIPELLPWFTKKYE